MRKRIRRETTEEERREWRPDEKSKRMERRKIDKESGKEWDREVKG